MGGEDRDCQPGGRGHRKRAGLGKDARNLDGENAARWCGHLENLLPKRAEVTPVVHHAAMPYREIAAFVGKLREIAWTRGEEMFGSGTNAALSRSLVSVPPYVRLGTA